MRTSSELTPEEYNEEVFYCESCHSLYVIADDDMADSDWDGSYCGKCFSAHIGKCTMGEWMKEEERRRAKRQEIEWSKL